MTFEFRASICGRDFDEYVARVFGPWDPDGPDSRTLSDLWHGRRLKIHQGGEWKEGRVLSWTHLFEGPEGRANWSLELEMADNVDEHNDKRRKIVTSSGETHAEVYHAENQTLEFQVNRMNVEGGGTLKPVSNESSTELISLEWVQPPEPALDLNKGVMSYRCPYCRAAEPVAMAHGDPSLERSQECPVCLETCDCRVLRCGHGVCRSCWDSCLQTAIMSCVELDELELDTEEIEEERAERTVSYYNVNNDVEALNQRFDAFAAIANGASSGKRGLTRFYREIMVETPCIWVLTPTRVFSLYEDMCVEALKSLLQVLHNRKDEIVEICHGGDQLFHSACESVLTLIESFYAKPDLCRFLIPWMRLADYHEKRCLRRDEAGARLCSLGLLLMGYGALTEALVSFDECLELRPNDEEAHEDRKGLLLEKKEWTGTSGTLTPRC